MTYLPGTLVFLITKPASRLYYMYTHWCNPSTSAVLNAITSSRLASETSEKTS